MANEYSATGYALAIRYEKNKSSMGYEIGTFFTLDVEFRLKLKLTLNLLENMLFTGGIMKRHDLQGITNHFDVKSVQEYSSKVEKFGGKVITPKTPVPRVGYFAICKDTENNTFSIFEADQTFK